jgi:hypothetical protein
MRSVRGPPGVTVAVGVGVEVVIIVIGVFVETVAGSGVESSEEMLAQPASKNRRIAKGRSRLISLNQLAY